MIRGVNVTLLQLSRQAGVPVWTPVQVENVLIAPLSEVDSTAGPLPEGHRALYHLAIPKSDTHRWEGQLVQFWNQTWAVIGIPTEGIENLIPGPWNKKVTVELYRMAAPDLDSLWRDVVALSSPTGAQDASGYPGTGTTTPRDVNAIIPSGILLETAGTGQKQGFRRKLNAEVWAVDYEGDALLQHEGIPYNITTVKGTGRGTVLLECEEVWR